MKENAYPKFLVLLQFGLIGLMILFSHGVLSSMIGVLVFLTGLVIGLWAIDHNKRDNFNIQPKLKEGCQLITTGAYNYIRHPMYTSVILMMLGVLVSTPTLLELFLFIILITVLVLKAKREEKLWCGHNKEYILYQRRTKLFIPYIL
jgi:protein-S-isoprenylcysteine O-methyltransferase Ste14